MQTELEDHSLVLLDELQQQSMHETALEFREGWEASKIALGVQKHPYVEFGYMLHRRSYKDGEFYKQMGVLEELYRIGEIDYIGVCELSLKDLEIARKITGKIDFLESELSMNVQFLITDGYIEYCRKYEINILGYCPLNKAFWSDNITSNIVTNQNAVGYNVHDVRQYFNMWTDDNFNKQFPMLQEVQQFAKKKGIQTTQVALSWVIAKGCIPIAGSASYKNNCSNIDAFDIKLLPKELTQLDNIITDMTRKWGIKRYS